MPYEYSDPKSSGLLYRQFCFLTVLSVLICISSGVQSRNWVDKKSNQLNMLNSVTSDCLEEDRSCLGFTHLSQAVIFASNRYNPVSIQEDREFIGAILYDAGVGGKYIYTVEAGVSGHDQVTTRIRIPKGYHLVAFWHTHGAAHWSRQFFSEIDTALAEKWQLPFYLANHTGELLVFEPGSPTMSIFQARRLGLGRQRGYARGRKIFDTRTGQAVSISTTWKSLDNISLIDSD